MDGGKDSAVFCCLLFVTPHPRLTPRPLPQGARDFFTALGADKILGINPRMTGAGGDSMAVKCCFCSTPHYDWIASERLAMTLRVTGRG